MLQSWPIHGIVRFGSFEVDTRSGELRKHGIRLKLQDQPFRVLQALIEHPGEVVTRDELQRRIWPSDTFVDFERGLNNAVKRLREALGDSAESPRYVETLPKRGYRFIGNVERIPALIESEEKRRGKADSTSLESPPRAIPRFWIASGVLLTCAGLAFGFNVAHVRELITGKVAAPRIQSLAVLPLQNLSNDPAQEYFSDGMTDALITDLAKIAAIRVISRTSMMRYKKTDKSIPEIARELNVDAIVEGTVQRSGDHVRISAQLIYGRSDKHLWAQSYERELQDTIRLQADVAEDVAEEISAKLIGADKPSKSKPSYRLDVSAYDAYLKGRNYTLRSVKGDILTGIEFLESSINRDPNYAPAYAELSIAYQVLAANNYMSPNEALVKAKGAAMKALALDANLGEAHSALGLVEGAFEWRWSDQDRELQRGIQLAPSSSQPHEWYAIHLAAMGRKTDAVREMTRALDLDPFSPELHSIASYIYYVNRDYELAIREARRALEIDPIFAPGHINLASALGAKSEFEEGFKEWLRYLQLSGDEELARELEKAAAKLSGQGDPGQKLGYITLRFYIEKSKSQYVGPLTIAAAYIDLGDKNKALDWLDNSAQEHSPSLFTLLPSPYCDSLRSETRFQDLLRRMNLPSMSDEIRAKPN
jgi:TolB-like protein/DNA-binding winged helix-turn-helix (wHTH) protein/Flp pilus assembly protein TadD